MRKISYYIIAVVIAGVAITSFWVYQRYFKQADQAFLYFKVDRGDIQEVVKVRSEVVAQKEFELEFPFSGIIESLYVHDGDAVSRGQRLMKLETRDFEIQRSTQQSVVSQRKADLEKLRVGATTEEINVSESKLASAKSDLNEAKKNLVDKIKDAYTKSDDAIRTKTDQLFGNPRTPSPILNITADSGAKIILQTQRAEIESVLNDWNLALVSISINSDLPQFLSNAKQNITLVSTFLNTLSPVVSNLTETANLAQATIDTYNAGVSTARLNAGTATANLVSAEEKFVASQASVSLSERELALMRAPARSEDIDIAQARITEAESQLNSINEKIRKSVLYSPASGKISKVNYEVGEVFNPGKSAISMTTSGYKLQADVSELDIAKVKESDGNNVRISLDAIQNQQFDGKVVSVDPKEIIKTEDKYYRVNIAFDAAGAEIRSGMSADAVILSSLKNGVLRVPALAIYTDGKTKYVKVLFPGLTKAISDKSFNKVDVTTGITDGEFVEVLSGLEEGQTAVVSAE